jgi:hypothetical protein
VPCIPAAEAQMPERPTPTLAREVRLSDTDCGIAGGLPAASKETLWGSDEMQTGEWGEELIDLD